MSTFEEPPVRTRSRARRLVLQALYRWQINQDDVAEVELQFNQNPLAERADMGFFHELFRGVIDNLADIDSGLAPFMSRHMESVDPVERAALRIGAYEIKYVASMHSTVAINEAVELCKMFGSEDGFKYINGVLDSYAKGRVKGGSSQGMP